ncbi:MAG: outer membrane beta-barrel protein [Verrucomicrobiales bacterium]
MVAAVAATVISSTAFAGPGFRLSSKAPLYHPPKAHAAYAFGYGGVDTGANYDTTGAFDEDWFAPGDPFDPSGFPVNFDLDTGWTAGGGAGIYSAFLGGSRFEIEGSFTKNEVGHLNYAGFALPANFDIKTKAVFFNLLKEVPLGHAIGYFGGGAGYASTTMEGDIDTILYDDSDDGFAWQLIAGVDFPITESLAFFTQYRYMVLSDQSFTTDFGDFTLSTDDNPSSHAVLFGARVSF